MYLKSGRSHRGCTTVSVSCNVHSRRASDAAWRIEIRKFAVGAAESWYVTLQEFSRWITRRYQSWPTCYAKMEPPADRWPLKDWAPPQINGKGWDRQLELNITVPFEVPVSSLAPLSFISWAIPSKTYGLLFLLHQSQAAVLLLLNMHPFFSVILLSALSEFFRLPTWQAFHATFLSLKPWI